MILCRNRLFILFGLHCIISKDYDNMFNLILKLNPQQNAKQSLALSKKFGKNTRRVFPLITNSSMKNLEASSGGRTYRKTRLLFCCPRHFYFLPWVIWYGKFCCRTKNQRNWHSQSAWRQCGEFMAAAFKGVFCFGASFLCYCCTDCLVLPE